MLNKYNFEYIQLEDLNTFEKIKLFMESETILSSNSSALTLSLFVSSETKIIEISNPNNKGTDHYKNICNTLSLNYNRYSNIDEDVNGNFNINVNNFEEYLINLLQ